MFGLGELPKEYNPKIHGPYDPAIFYGKKDIPLGEVKLGELPGWMARRSKNPVDWARAVSRAFWRWNHKYWFPRNVGMIPLYQTAVGLMAIGYFFNYPRISHHANYKYHW